MFQVHCENKVETCVLPKKPTIEFEIKDNKSFWLSDNFGWKIENIYGVRTLFITV